MKRPPKFRIPPFAPAVTLCLAAPGCAPSFTPYRSRESVARVIDGDTLVLASGEHVRLLGLDAPERGKPGYREAAEALRKLLAGKPVRVAREGRDRWGRTLARLYLADGTDLSAELIARGLARPWPKPRTP